MTGTKAVFSPRYPAMTLVAAAALLAALVLPASAQANLLANPGFEDGATGPIGDGVPGWSIWANSGWHHDDAGKTIDQKAIKFWWDDSFAWQDFAVVGGAPYDYSVQVLNASDDPLTMWNGLLKAEFYDSSIGTDSGDVLLSVDVDRYFSATDPLDAWVELSGSVVAPANADIGRIILMITDWQAGPSGSLNFDNASVVPEPATLGLLALGFVSISRRRRVRA